MGEPWVNQDAAASVIAYSVSARGCRTLPFTTKHLEEEKKLLKIDIINVTSKNEEKNTPKYLRFLWFSGFVKLIKEEHQNDGTTFW